MQSQRQQGFAIPVVVIFICLLAFGIPYLVSGGRDAHSDVVLVPRQSPTPTPLDRILTQQAFANLFFTPTSDSFFKILVTGPSATPGLGSPTPVDGFASPTSAVVPPIYAFFTRVSDGGNSFSSPTSPPTLTPLPTRTPIPTNTPVPTNTPIPTATNSPVPTNTAAPTVTYTSAPTDTNVPPTSTNTPAPTDTSEPPTNTPVPPTDTSVPPPTDTPAPPPTDTAEPPPTDTPVPGGNGNSGIFLFGAILLLPFAVVLLPGIFSNQK